MGGVAASWVDCAPAAGPSDRQARNKAEIAARVFMIRGDYIILGGEGTT
jgi:hypothetical protein